MESLLQNSLFYIVVTCISFFIGQLVHQKTKSSLANPLLIAILLMITFLSITGIPLQTYKEGTKFISMLLGPATMSLGITVYRQRVLMKKHLLAIVIGTFIGSLTSIVSVVVFSKLVGLDQELLISLVPKSVTTPIAMNISELMGGIVPLSVASVIITGILGSVVFPILVNKMKYNSSVSIGVAFGTASHALGTAKAVEIGEEEGAVSSVSLIFTGIFTYIIILFYVVFFNK